MIYKLHLLIAVLVFVAATGYTQTKQYVDNMKGLVNDCADPSSKI